MFHQSSLPLRVDREYNFHPKCFDIPIEMEDPLKSKMAQVVQHIEGQEGKEIVKLEDNVGELAYFAKDLKQKRDFLESFAYVLHLDRREPAHRRNQRQSPGFHPQLARRTSEGPGPDVGLPDWHGWPERCQRERGGSASKRYFQSAMG